jgi:general secretion pathway protein A
VTLEENEVFSPRAVKRIVHHARGIPRTINIVCDNALITGYGYQQNPISRGVAAEVISDMEGKPARGRLSRWVLGLAAVVLLVVASLMILLQSTWRPVLFAAPTGRQDSPTARFPQPAPGTTGP